MRFSWTGLILAPLLVPAIFSTTMVMLVVSEGSLTAFLTMLVVSCVVSYGTTIFVFLPCLFLLSSEREMSGLKVCLLGSMLGTLAPVSLALISWGSIDPDAGFQINFFVFFLRFAAGPVTPLFPLAGLITAGLYWWLGAQRKSQSVSGNDNT